MLRRIFALLIALISFACVSSARAQFVGHVTQGEFVSDGDFWYAALSCQGNRCVALAIGGANGLATNGIAFLRSTDGGYTWKIEDTFAVSHAWYERPNLARFVEIDSLNLIAYGRSDSIYRTTDGGATWQQQALASSEPIGGISFSDPSHGFVVLEGFHDSVLTTTDGGLDWIPSRLRFMIPGGTANCKDYGHGKYRIVSYDYGKVYTTEDNWATVDSTERIVDPSLSNKYVFGNCSFIGVDTILAFANYLNVKTRPFPLIARTTNGGRDWKLVYADTVRLVGNVHALSDVNRDTIVAGLSSGPPNVLLSTDRGATWSIDSLICNDTNFIPAVNAGIGLNASGNLVGAYGLGQLSSSLIVATQASLAVQNRDENIETLLYPNPATSVVHALNLKDGSTIHFIDMLGREPAGDVIVGRDGTVDVSRLPRGMYSVVANRDNAVLPLGRVVLVRK